MIKATLVRSDGRKGYVFGLSARNLELLKEGKPIFFDLEPLGGQGSVLILFGEHEADLVEQLREFAEVPHTVVVIKEG